MIEAVLRGVRHMGNRMAAVVSRSGGGGCGIHFDAGGMQFVRVIRGADSDRLHLSAYGMAALEDDMLRGGLIVKPEAVARRLEELLERLGMRVQDLRDDTMLLALPAHSLKTEIIDYPSGLPPRAVRAWCERRAALLLPGDGDPELRCRVGVAWADPGSHRLRLHACEGNLVDDRVAVLEMSGLQAHAVDAAHEAGRRAFRWSRPESDETAIETAIDEVVAPDSGREALQVPSSGTKRAGKPVALLQIDRRDLDLAVFDGATCIADIRERFDGVGGHPEALASVVRELVAAFPVAPLAIYVAAQGVSPGELTAICEAAATACGIAVRPFDPLRRFERSGRPPGQRRETFAQRAALAVPCGLALRAISMQGVSCEAM